MNLGSRIVTGILAAVLVSVSSGTAGPQGKTTKLRGYVVDSACSYLKGLKKPISPECATACAKAGSPLAILADNGHLYLPISDKMPAIGQNERLLKFAGRRVVVTGKIYERNGGHALVIDTVEAEASSK